MIRKVVLEDEEILKKIAIERLEPLYGNQDKAINGWLYGSDNKIAYVKIVNDNIAGLLSLKDNDKKDYLKISTLLVLDSYKGHGVASELLTYAENYALSKKYKKIKVTVSDIKNESLCFFKKKNFITTDKIFGKYIPDVYENIMEKEV